MWRIKSRALRERRLEKLWSIEHLAKTSGVSVRTLIVLEKSDEKIRLATLDCIAKALGVAPREIARQEDEADASRAKSRGSAHPEANGASEPPLRAYGPDVTVLPQLTRLEQLVAMETALPPQPPLRTASGEVPRMTAKRYQDIFTAFRVHEGTLAYVSGLLQSQRGMSIEQAALCGTKCGEGARFHFVYEVQPGHEVGMTVHTSDGALTGALQSRTPGPAGAIVKVVVAPEEIAAKGGGFEFFMSNTKTLRPWGLEVVRVVDPGEGASADASENAPARAKAGAKAKRTAGAKNANGANGANGKRGGAKLRE